MPQIFIPEYRNGDQVRCTSYEACRDGLKYGEVYTVLGDECYETERRYSHSGMSAGIGYGARLYAGNGSGRSVRVYYVNLRSSDGFLYYVQSHYVTPAHLSAPPKKFVVRNPFWSLVYLVAGVYKATFRPLATGKRKIA